MDKNLTAKGYYAFMFVLPLLFYPDIIDKVLLPRQLLLSVFVLLLAVPAWKTFQNTQLKVDAVNLALVAYLLVAAAVSFANANVLSEALYGLSKWWIIIAFSLLLAVLLNNKILTIQQITNGAILFGCIAITTAVADFYDKGVRGKHLLHWVYTVSGGFANKNLLSSVLFLCLPFFSIGLHRRKLKIVSGVAIVLVLFLLVVLRSRIVLVATFVYFGMVALFYLTGRNKRKAWLLGSFAMGVVAVAGLFGLVAASPDAEKYLHRLFDSRTLQERLFFWQHSLDMFVENPMGVGLGNWQVYFPKYGLDASDTFAIVNGTHTLQRPHNDFLWSLCETGVLGFAVYLCVFGMALYQSVKLIRTSTDNEEKRVDVYLFAGLVGFVLISFFDFPMERIEHLVLLILLLSMIIHRYTTRFQSGFSVPGNKKTLFLFVGLGVCFSFTVAWVRFVAEKQVFQLYAATAGRPHEAQFLARKAEGMLYTIDSKTIPMVWYKGVAQFSMKQYADSEGSFEKAYAVTPYNIHVINNLASAYEVNGKRSEAITMYKKALRISPRFEEARLNLAAVYFNDKQYEKAFVTIDSCSVKTRDPKYKMFLPPILKGKANSVLAAVDFPVSAQKKQKLVDLQDFSSLYRKSKRNNITFERQIINYLKK